MQGRVDSALNRHRDSSLGISCGVFSESVAWTARASTELGIPQPKISALANYRLNGFSVEGLLNALGRDVVIQVGHKKHAGSTGKTSVSAA